MTNKEKNDLFYVCSLIEFISRKTNNHRGTVVNQLGAQGIAKQLEDASVNHSLSFQQVSDEVIQHYNITNGNFDTITDCKYKIPSETAIGRIYQKFILYYAEEGEKINELINIFNSFISDEISNFSTNVYYSNFSYLRCSYEAGMLLD